MSMYLGFQCCIEIDERLYFSSFRGNGLFCYNGEAVEHICSFEEEGPKLFSDATQYGDRIYFTPLTASRIYFYDLKMKRLDKIEYGHKSIADFGFSILNGNDLYMFPTYYSGILKLNLETHDIDIIDSWLNDDYERCKMSEAPYFRGDYVRNGDVVYIPFSNAHAVLEFHLGGGESNVHDVGKQDYSTIASDGSTFWMAPRTSGAIVSWNPSTCEVIEYPNFPEGFLQGGFVGSFFEDGYVWIFPETSNMVLKINAQTGEIVEEVGFSDICGHKMRGYSVWNAVFVYMKKNAERILLCSGRSSEIVFFHPNTGEVRRFRLELPDQTASLFKEEPYQWYAAFRNKKIKRLFSYENQSYDVGAYLEYVVECSEYIEEYLMEKKEENSKDFGEVIYRGVW